MMQAYRTEGNYRSAARLSAAELRAAMALLAEVGRRTWNNDDSNTNTIHSVVYDLTDRSVLWVGNEHYGEDGYTFEFQLGA